MERPVTDLVNLVQQDEQELGGLGLAEARQLLLDADPRRVLEISGSFALIARQGEQVRLARSLDRPLRYFLAKQPSGPLLVVGERIDQILACLEERGYADQFHPSYTRMVPAHHVTTLRLVGCPDPNPVHRRFFDPPRGVLPADPQEIGRTYVEALMHEVQGWLRSLPGDSPIGVLFSGGIDSGSVLLAVYQGLLELGSSPARLKAFTLQVDGGGPDAEQAREFLRRTDLEMLGETIDVRSEHLDPLEAVRVIEDYKPLDVECATVALALLRGIHERYPDWRHVADGDGGDENLKDYPLEEGGELTIRSVVGNSMLYQEGWGVDAIKHSLTYSGGYSRSCVRTWAPLRKLGFSGFSPYTRPALISVAEAIPFDDLTRGSTERLYDLKGEIVASGCRQVLGRELPVFPKRRFQEGAVPEGAFGGLFGAAEARYRRHFLDLFDRAR